MEENRAAEWGVLEVDFATSLIYRKERACWFVSAQNDDSNSTSTFWRRNGVIEEEGRQEGFSNKTSLRLGNNDSGRRAELISKAQPCRISSTPQKEILRAK